ncbi:MAG: hypothetical protein H6899_00320 [Rhodobacter sp.]|nr:hypothetical protein [Rhodobacter sp.]
MAKLSIDTVSVNDDGGDEGDNVLIRVQSDGGAPARFPLLIGNFMNNASKDWTPNVVYYFNHTCYVSLWDNDENLTQFSADDFLGSAYFTPESPSGTVRVYGSDGADYEITVTITDENLPTCTSTALDPSTVVAINNALTSFEQSSKGQEMISTTNPQSLFKLAVDALATDAISEVINLLKSQLNIKAVSIGLMGQVDTMVGISGCCGAVMDILDTTDNAVIFAAGGITEGAEEGFDGDLAFGIWYEPVASINGLYFGGEVDEDAGLGFEGAAFCAGDDRKKYYKNGQDGEVDSSVLKMIFIAAGFGEQEAVAADEAYFYAGNVGGNVPAFQSGSYTHTVRVNQVTCLVSESGSKHYDDCRFNWSPDCDNGNSLCGAGNVFVYPITNSFEMSEDTSDPRNILEPGAIMRFNDFVKIAFYEGKGSEGISQLGTLACVNASDFTAIGDMVTVEFKNTQKGTCYQMQIELVEIDAPDPDSE